jgi:hypothetical protein
MWPGLMHGLGSKDAGGAGMEAWRQRETAARTRAVLWKSGQQLATLIDGVREGGKLGNDAALGIHGWALIL